MLFSIFFVFPYPMIQNEESFKEIEDEIYNIYEKIIKLENSLSSLESKNKVLKDELQKQFENFESRINSINSINGSNDENNISVEKIIVNSGNFSNSS